MAKLLNLLRRDNAQSWEVQIAFEIILSTDEIVDVDCNATLRLTRDFVSRLFLNHNIIKDEEMLKKEVTTRYFGSSSKAILTAYHDALQHYKKVKK